MDAFEKELARMMRDTEESTPFDSEHGTRLKAGVRSRRRARTAWAAGGAAAAIVALAAGLLFLPGTSADEGPAGPVPTAPPTPRPPTHAPQTNTPQTTTPPPPRHRPPGRRSTVRPPRARRPRRAADHPFPTKKKVKSAKDDEHVAPPRDPSRRAPRATPSPHATDRIDGASPRVWSDTP